MNNNLDNIALDLYGKIQTRFPDITIGDENAAVLSKKSYIPSARFFEFEYEENGIPLGTIAITLDEVDGIVIQISGDLANDTSSHYHDAFTFIRSFRKFAKNRLLNFDVQNIGKSNLDKRDYQFQAKKTELPHESPMMESKMFGTSRISYQDLGEARLMVKHTQPINPDIAAGRSMHIRGIYIENADGERFKYPYKHLHGARALAEHIKHGGNPYDAIGTHITGLSEEMNQLRKFKGYVTRQEQVSEAMGTVTGKVLERIDTIKKEIHNLQRSSYYEQFAESFQIREQRLIPEDIMNDWVDRLTVRTFNEELKSVFPYLYDIIAENELPVREIDADDLLGEANCSVVDDAAAYWGNQSTESLLPEFAFESFIDQIMNEDKNELFSPHPGAQNKAVKDLNILLASELAGGTSGILALKGIIDDPVLLGKIEVLGTDAEIRQEIKDYILDKNPKLIKLLPELNNPAPADIGGEKMPPAAGEEMPPVAGEEMPPVAGEEMPPVAGEEMPPVAGEEMPPVAGKKSPMSMTEGANKSSKMKAKFIKAKLAGATLDTPFADKMTVRDAIRECGLEPMECGFSDNSTDSKRNGVGQLLRVIVGFWNKAERNFTIGGTRAKIKLVKAYEDGECPQASGSDVKKVLLLIDKMDPGSDESAHQHDVLRLAGVANPSGYMDTRENKLLSNLTGMKEQSLAENVMTQIKRNAGLL